MLQQRRPPSAIAPASIGVLVVALGVLVASIPGNAFAARLDCSEPCKTEGVCKARRGKCIATSKKHCEASVRCKQAGACTLKKGACVIADTGDCAASADCLHKGRCHFVVDRCEPVLPTDCQRSVECMGRARCSLVKGQCTVASDADCALSNVCKLRGKCTFYQGRCIIGRNLDRRASAASRTGIVAGIGVAMGIVGNSPDPTLYTGLGFHAGWAFRRVTVVGGAELYPKGSFVASRTANAVSSGVSPDQVQVEQKTNTALARFGAWAQYFLLGEHGAPFSLMGNAGFSVMSYSLAFEELPPKPGYEELGNAPQNLVLVHLDTGLTALVKAGPVHVFGDFRLGLPLVGGDATTLDLSAPVPGVFQVGARFSL